MKTIDVFGWKGTPIRGLLKLLSLTRTAFPEYVELKNAGSVVDDAGNKIDSVYGYGAFHDRVDEAVQVPDGSIIMLVSVSVFNGTNAENSNTIAYWHLTPVAIKTAKRNARKNAQ